MENLRSRYKNEMRNRSCLREHKYTTPLAEEVIREVHLSEGSIEPESDTHSMDFVGAHGPCSGQVLGGITDRGGCCRFRLGREQETTKR